MVVWKSGLAVGRELKTQAVGGGDEIRAAKHFSHHLFPEFIAALAGAEVLQVLELAVGKEGEVGELEFVHASIIGQPGGQRGER